ncbi:hypothetical protein G4B88_030122 [Cannabis sativa]|uniref:Uncharacterized protein n=1 Tax=Cannabis sativa TaxID=3483 RepID=A0A7J6DJ95_CANSA|nr:hypothetical protein G4B88_030122 [Cannabis sativa]
MHLVLDLSPRGSLLSILYVCPPLYNV